MNRSKSVKVQIIYKDTRKSRYDYADMHETIIEAFKNSPKYKSVEFVSDSGGDGSIILLVEEANNEI